MKGEDNDLIGFQNNLNKGILNYEGNSERTRSSTIINKPNSSNIRDNKTRKSVLTSGFGSLSRLINKKEELSKSNKDLNTKQKKELNFLIKKEKKILHYYVLLLYIESFLEIKKN